MWYIKKKAGREEEEKEMVRKNCLMLSGLVVILTTSTACEESGRGLPRGDLPRKGENTLILEEFNEIKVQSADEVEIAFNELYTGKDMVIIICHGIMQSKDSQIFTKMAREFEENYDIINMDLRGHGRSGGGCTLTSMEVQDLKVVVDYARQRHKKVGILGFSLGAATAILESAEYKNIDSLILVSPFTKISKVNFKLWKRPSTYTTSAKEFITDTNRRIKIGNVFLFKTAPIAVIDKISPTPVLFLHGSDDWVIDSSHSQKLYEKAKEPKKLVIFENAFHAEYIYEKFPQEFKKVCLGWFEETMSKR